jgi:hypothetical protein
MKPDRIIAAAAARGKELRLRVHLSVTGDDLAPICGAQAMWGWGRYHGDKLKPCPRCEAKAERMEARK